MHLNKFCYSLFWKFFLPFYFLKNCSSRRHSSGHISHPFLCLFLPFPCRPLPPLCSGCSFPLKQAAPREFLLPHLLRTGWSQMCAVTVHKRITATFTQIKRTKFENRTLCCSTLYCSPFPGYNIDLDTDYPHVFCGYYSILLVNSYQIFKWATNAFFHILSNS